ncbi:transposase [Aromatoleum bremense]|uniref:transposase n=1 Tax=Aromatoleum bremense TaxID=76115 RepID=UPI001FD49C6F|nr:transposase [Aromatoleum bremense]
MRLELSGGLYHVTSRGDGRDDIYLSEEDREIWLAVLGQVCKRFNWVCHAWCQMTNHYHLVIETPEANLAAGMRQLNGVYTQRFNRLHGRVGHVFQGRYKAILVERDSYLLELARYVVLNPLRAGMVREPESWRWSSYLSTCGLAPAPEWLRTDWVLAQFGRRRVSAIRKYVQFVHQGARLPSIWTQLRGQIYLGSEAFVAQMHTQLEQRPSLDEIPRAQRRGAPQPLTDFESRYGRREAMARAYLSGQHTMAAIAEHFGVHYSTVSRMVRSHENSGKR